MDYSIKVKVKKEDLAAEKARIKKELGPNMAVLWLSAADKDEGYINLAGIPLRKEANKQALASILADLKQQGYTMADKDRPDIHSYAEGAASTEIDF